MSKHPTKSDKKMAQNFGFNSAGPSGAVRNFDSLVVITRWAGVLGIGQALLWIGLTITAILSYNCIVPLESPLSFGTLIGTVFVQRYFMGSCQAPNNVQFSDDLLQQVQQVLSPEDVLIWVCVYLGVAVCWLIASVVLFTHVRKDCAMGTLVTLYTWIGITACICAMDLALGVIFGVDYSRYRAAAKLQNFSSIQGGAVDAMAGSLLAGMVVAMSLMIVAFKGFVLWIINAGLIVYLTMRAMAIVNDKDGNDTLFMPRKDSDDILATTRPPINAYDEIKASENAYTNEMFISDTPMTTNPVVEVNQDSLIRAARMSSDNALLEHRFRNIDSYQQYPPPRQMSQPSYQLPANEFSIAPQPSTTSPYPVPDYSPQMQRAQPPTPQGQGQGQGQGILRNQRYQ